jgi:hypothetical protein
MSELGVPESAIIDMACYAERTAIQSELAYKQEHQYAMEFKREGVAVMAERYSITPQAARKRFNKAIGKLNSLPEVAQAVA